MSAIKVISVEHIRPFAGQPRTYFEPQALQELADSIKQHGQYTPAWVVPIDDQYGRYELIAGERRWRACQLAGIPTLLCEVREGLSQEQQYVASVMENFGRKDCTVMETARSVGHLLKQYGGDYAKTASVFSRSVAWVRNVDMLNRLETEVALMLDPPNAKLTTQVAVSLANLRPDVQIRLAKEIARRGMKHRSALSFVRSSVTNDQRVAKRGKRRPSDDFEILKRFLGSLGPQAQAILALGPERLAAMFAHRDPKAKRAVCDVLSKRIDQLRELEEVLENDADRDSARRS